MSNCHACGNPLKGSEKFCKVCGTPVVRDAAPAEAAPSPRDASSYYPVSDPVLPPAPPPPPDCAPPAAQSTVPPPVQGHIPPPTSPSYPPASPSYPPASGGGAYPAQGYPQTGVHPYAPPSGKNTPYGAPAYGSPPPKKSKTGLIALLLVLVLAAGGVGLYFYGSSLAGDPEEDIAAFMGAIRRKSVSGITSVVSSEGLTLNESTLTPIFRLADEQDGKPLAELEASLLGQLDGKAPAKGLEAIALVSEKKLLFFSAWQIVIRPVNLELTTSAPDCLFLVDGEPVSPQAAAQHTAQGLVPGFHDVRVRYEGYGLEASSPAVRALCLANASVEVPFPECAAVSIPCDFEADVYINGELTEIKAEGGALTFTAVRGMKLRIQPQRGGETYEHTVEDPKLLEAIVLKDSDSGSRPSGDSEEDGEETEPEEKTPEKYREPFLDDMLRYYRSYLDAINKQDSGKLEACSDKQREYAAERVANPLNATNLFEFTEIVVDMDTLEYYTREDGRFAAKMRIGLRYDFKPRSGGAWEEGGNTQWCEFIEEPSGEWICDYTEVRDSDTLSDNQIIVG